LLLLLPHLAQTKQARTHAWDDGEGRWWYLALGLQLLTRPAEYEREPDKLEPLDVYLDCEESHDEVYQATLDHKVPGTCHWILERPDFIPWMQNDEPPVWIYWLHAPPGTGKSVMSASVISMLLDKGRDAFYFFFVNGNKYHRTVAGMLRFMAFQMAQSHREVEEAIEGMQAANGRAVERGRREADMAQALPQLHLPAASWEDAVLGPRRPGRGCRLGQAVAAVQVGAQQVQPPHMSECHHGGGLEH
jgi:hypothetical protein